MALCRTYAEGITSVCQSVHRSESRNEHKTG